MKMKSGLDVLRQKEKFLNQNSEELREHIKKLKEEINLVQTCLNFVERRDLEDRKFLEGVSVDILKKLVPKSALDPEGVKLRSYLRNTGIYLWLRGYNPTKFLGAGCNGVVWQCEDKAVKVTCNRTLGPFTIVNATAHEIEDVGKLKKIIDDVEESKGIAGSKYKYEGKKSTKKTIDPGRYISVVNDKGKIDDERHIFESELAKGDLSKEIQNERDLDTIIRIGKQVLKALKVIHDAGYSHNDVKLDNLLSVERVSKKLKSKKEAIKLSDFGAMTKIDHTRKIFVNSKFYAPDWYNISPKAVEKRDVYAVGIVLFSLLMRDKNVNHVKKIAKELYLKGLQNFLDEDKYGLKKIYENDEDNKKLTKLLGIIRPMVAGSYKQRLSIDESLKRVEILSRS